MKRGSRWASAIVLVLGLAAAAVSSASGQAQAEGGYTLRIGDVVPFTGASAVFGPAYAKAAGLAVQEAKKALRANGITNVKIQIEHADDGTTPDGGVNAARKLLANGAGCMLGALTSASSIAIAQAATVPARVPQIGPNNSSPALTTLQDNGYFFRVMPSDLLQAPILAKVIQQELGRPGMAPRLTAVLRQWMLHDAGYPANWMTDVERLLSQQSINIVPAGAGVGEMKEEYGRSLQILHCVCGVVLLIACANVANLLLARGMARRMQTSLRLAVGASRAHIISQCLVESLLL